MSIDTRVDIAIRGVRMAAPVHRQGGAGPSDDGHLTIDGANAAVPVNPDSPYQVRDGRLWLGEDDTGLRLGWSPRPKFYDLTTADGVPYRQIALLHGADVLASTVVQTCIRYGEASGAGSAPSRSRCTPAARSRPRPRPSWPRWPRPRCGWTGCASWC